MAGENWKIYWNDYTADTYLYGSEITYYSKDNVEFKNELMPPGAVIKEWFSKVNFQADRIEPSLPIIDGESKYKIRVNIDCESKEGCIVRLVFLDKYENEAGYFIVREDEEEFSCPLKTYSYKMQLINGGISELTYHCVEIEELIEDE